MQNKIRNTIGEKLLQEAGHVLEEYFHQPIDEAITDLRIRCLIDKDARDPVDILHGLHFSGLFYQIHNEPAALLRNAIARFVNGNYGLCLHCGDSIPVEWLLKSPLLSYCSRCMVNMRPLYREETEREPIADYANY